MQKFHFLKFWEDGHKTVNFLLNAVPFMIIRETFSSPFANLLISLLKRRIENQCALWAKLTNNWLPRLDEEKMSADRDTAKNRLIFQANVTKERNIRGQRDGMQRRIMQADMTQKKIFTANKISNARALDFFISCPFNLTKISIKFTMTIY